jgi:hypothetical protein
MENDRQQRGSDCPHTLAHGVQDHRCATLISTVVDSLWLAVGGTEQRVGKRGERQRQGGD